MCEDAAGEDADRRRLTRAVCAVGMRDRKKQKKECYVVYLPAKDGAHLGARERQNDRNPGDAGCGKDGLQRVVQPACLRHLLDVGRYQQRLGLRRAARGDRALLSTLHLPIGL